MGGSFYNGKKINHDQEKNIQETKYDWLKLTIMYCEFELIDYLDLKWSFAFYKYVLLLIIFDFDDNQNSFCFEWKS